MGNLSENFDIEEFACKDNCGFKDVSMELVTLLEDIRADFNSPIVIYSGCRCQNHNEAVGGASNSQHLYGLAADIYVVGVQPNMLAEYLSNKYQGSYGVGKYAGFTHIDVRSGGPARWGF